MAKASALVHHLSHLVRYLRDTLIVEETLLAQVSLKAEDGIPGHPFGDLLLSAVGVSVKGRVSAMSVGLALDEGGTITRQRALAGLAHDLVNGDNIVAVNDHAGHIIGTGLIRDILHRRGTGKAGAHGILVVDADPHHGELPDRGKIQGLVERALVGSAVAEPGQHNAPRVEAFLRERCPRGDGECCTNDPLHAEVIGRRVRKMTRSATPSTAPGCPAKDLGHQLSGLGSLGNVCHVSAVAGQDIIFGGKGHAGADVAGFFANTQVSRTRDEPLVGHLLDTLLEQTAQYHVAVHLHQKFLAQCHAFLLILI